MVTFRNNNNIRKNNFRRNDRNFKNNEEKKILEDLKMQNNKNIKILAGPCMGRCDVAPTVCVGKNYVDNAFASKVEKAIQENRFEVVVPNYISLDESILNMFFKYYYTFELTEDNISILSNNMTNGVDLNINAYKKYLDYLKTPIEKNQFNLFCFDYGNIIISLKYLDFNAISSNNLYIYMLFI